MVTAPYDPSLAVLQIIARPMPPMAIHSTPRLPSFRRSRVSQRHDELLSPRVRSKESHTRQGGPAGLLLQNAHPRRRCSVTLIAYVPGLQIPRAHLRDVLPPSSTHANREAQPVAPHSASQISSLPPFFLLPRRQHQASNSPSDSDVRPLPHAKGRTLWSEDVTTLVDR